MPFLELPIGVRKKIYAHAGLARPCPIDLLNEKTLKNQRRPHFQCILVTLASGILTIRNGVPECHCPELPVSVLRVCRKVYNEALAVLYGANDFMVLSRSPGDLRTILRIPPDSLKYIRSLLIRLNCWPCPRGHDLHHMGVKRVSCSVCRSSITNADDAISFATEEGQQMIDEWSSTASHLSKVLLSRQVHLSLIADVAGEQEAHAIVASLRKLPTLKQLDIRLGRNGEPRLRDIATEAVELMTGRYRPSSKFSFEQLPVEVQRRIIEFTELAPSGHRTEKPQCEKDPQCKSREVIGIRAPGGGVEFFQGPRLEQATSRQLTQDRDQRSRGRGYIFWKNMMKFVKHDGELYVRNNRINKAGQAGEPSHLCCRSCTLTAFSCCCRHLYAAESAYCLCRYLAFSLFYVSKSVNELATEIFYSQNCFVFHQSLPMTCEFLQNLEPSILRRMQAITIRPSVTGKYGQDMHFATINEADLERIMYNLKHKTKLSKLSFTFDTEGFWDTALWSEDWRGMYEEHCTVARHMKALKGAQKLAFNSCRLSWDAELGRQVEGGEPLEWDVFRKGFLAWERLLGR